jgi:Major Facilitator Superfamily
MAAAQLKQPLPPSPGQLTFVKSPAYKWWVTWTMMLGAFLVALDTTIVNLAIPKIMTSLSADLNQIQWVLILYMIGMAVVMPTVDWLSDLVRYKWVYTGSLALFTGSSALCGTARNPSSLPFRTPLSSARSSSSSPPSAAFIFLEGWGRNHRAEQDPLATFKHVLDYPWSAKDVKRIGYQVSA